METLGRLAGEEAKLASSSLGRRSDTSSELSRDEATGVDDAAEVADADDAVEVADADDAAEATRPISRRGGG